MFLPRLHSIFLSCACSLPSFPRIKMADFRKGLKKFTYDDDCDAEPEESSLNEEENDVPSDTGESEEEFDSSSTSATSKSGFESPEYSLSEESVI